MSLARVAKRGSATDSFITLDYLFDIYKAYEEFIVAAEVPVVVLSSQEMMGLHWRDIVSPFLKEKM